MNRLRMFETRERSSALSAKVAQRETAQTEHATWGADNGLGNTDRNAVQRLNDSGLPSGERRALASQIGQAQGNRYLQRALKQDGTVQRQSAGQPTLRMGSRSPAVRTLQQLLIDHGASLNADGIFGAQTRQALMVFQRSANLASDGVCGSQTWSSLGGSSTTQSTAQGGDPAQAARVTAMLNQITARLHLIQQSRAPVSSDVPQVEATAAPPLEFGHDDAENDDDDSLLGKAASWVEEKTGDAADWVGDKATEAADWVEEKTGDAADWVGDKAGEAADWVGQQASGVEKWAGNTWDDAKKEVSGAVTQVQNELNDFEDDLKKRFGPEIQAIQQAISDLGRGLGLSAEAEEKLKEILKNLDPDQPQEGEEGPPHSGTLPPIMGSPHQMAHGCDAAEGRPEINFNLGLDPNVQEGQTPETREWGNDLVDSSGMVVVPGVSQGETVDAGWGKATPSFSKELINWTAENNKINVNAQLKVDVKWGVRPNGCTDISGPDDPAVTAKTWDTIVQELTPDSSTGEPNRKAFWSQSITQQHEMFHVNDYIDQARRDLPEQQKIMNSKNIDTPWWWWDSDRKRVEFNLNSLLQKARDNVEASGFAHYQDGGETRAYQAGAASYTSLVQAIKAKAAANKWPKNLP